MAHAMPGTSIARAFTMTEALGWASSVVLLATIVEQLRKQWHERSARGVSRWLFVGQALASVGFTIYSALLGNWVFTVTNALLLASAILGVVMTWHFKRAAGGAQSAAPEWRAPDEVPRNVSL